MRERFGMLGSTIMACLPYWWVDMVDGRIRFLGFSEVREPWAAYLLGPPGPHVDDLIERFKGYTVPDEVLQKERHKLPIHKVVPLVATLDSVRPWFVTSPDGGRTAQFIAANERGVTMVMLQPDYWRHQDAPEQGVSLQEAIVRAARDGRLG